MLDAITVGSFSSAPISGVELTLRLACDRPNLHNPNCSSHCFPRLPDLPIFPGSPSGLQLTLFGSFYVFERYLCKNTKCFRPLHCIAFSMRAVNIVVAQINLLRNEWLRQLPHPLPTSPVAHGHEGLHPIPNLQLPARKKKKKKKKKKCWKFGDAICLPCDLKQGTILASVSN